MPIQQIELANLILDQVNEHIDDDFLEQEGIFRRVGSLPKVNKAYQKARTRPKGFHLSKMGEDFLLDNNNVVSLLKKALGDPKRPIQFDGAVASYLKEKEREAFIAEGKFLKEAKLLHNLIYLSRCIVEHAEKNKMTASNVSIALLGPKIAGWINGDAEELAQKELQRKSSSHFDKPFHEAYPQLQIKKESTSRLKRVKKSLSQKRKSVKAGIKGINKGISRKRKAVGEVIKRAVKRRKKETKEPNATAVWYDAPQEPSTTWYHKEDLSDALKEPQKEKQASPKRAMKPEAWPSDVSSAKKKYQPILSPIKENYAQETKMHYEDVKREKKGQGRGKPIMIERDNQFGSLKRKFEQKPPPPPPKNKPHLGA